jgi:hypothetical protein
VSVARLQNHGRVFPYWLDLTDPEAVRGTRHIRTVDPNLTVGLDTRQHVYSIWGPSLSEGGWVQLLECRDDQWRPFRGFVPWELITAAIRRQMDDAERGIFVTDRVQEANQRREQRAEREQSEAYGDALDYAARAVSRELSGDSPWSAEDVVQGYHNAREGRSRAPRKQRHFGPGLPVAG